MLLEFENNRGKFIQILSSELCAIELKCASETYMRQSSYYNSTLYFALKNSNDPLKFNLTDDGTSINSKFIEMLINNLDEKLIPDGFSKIKIGKYSTFYYRSSCIVGLTGYKDMVNVDFNNRTFLLSDNLNSKMLNYSEYYSIIFQGGFTYPLRPELEFDILQRKLKLKNL